jgi:hypothetical protein
MWQALHATSSTIQLEQDELKKLQTIRIGMLFICKTVFCRSDAPSRGSLGMTESKLRKRSRRGVAPTVGCAIKVVS